MLKIVKKEYVTVIEWAFKIAYLLLGLSTFNTFLYGSAIQPFLVKLCLLLGMLALIGRVLFFKSYISTPYWIMLVLFCVSFAVSIVMNRGYGQAVADIKWLIWNGMLFALLYVCDTERSVSAYKKECNVLANIMIAYGTIAAATGIYMMFTLYQKTWFTASGEKMLAGFWWGRLWGVYTDPNYGGIFSVVVVLLSVYFLKKVKYWKKVIYTIPIIVNGLYMIFSDSRAAELCMIAAVGFWILFAAVSKYKRGKGLVAGILVSAVFAAVFLGGTTYIKNQCNVEIQKEIAVLQAKKATQANQTKGQNASGAARKADIEKDVSNGRFALWKSGIEVWQTSPVIGTGYTSFLPYTKANLPTTYAVNNSQGEYVSLHNTYLNILVYQGAVGAAIFLVFMVLIFLRGCRNIRRIEAQDRDYVAVLTACVLVVALSMVFLLDGLYTNSPESFILWTFLGYLMHYLTSSTKSPSGLRISGVINLDKVEKM